MKIAALAACLSVAAADSKTCSAGCSGGRGGVECTGDDGDKGSCFFSSCTCEYRGTVSGCSTSDACVGWKQTGDGCDSKGRKVGSSELAATLAAGKNLACCEYVPTGAVGYCECRNGAKVREVGCGGRTDNFNCQAECEKAGYQPTPNPPPPPRPPLTASQGQGCPPWGCPPARHSRLASFARLLLLSLRTALRAARAPPLAAASASPGPPE